MKSSFTNGLLSLLACYGSQVAAQGSYQKFAIQTGTSFKPETNGIWTLADCDGDGILDLVYIKTTSVQSGKVELHYATGASKFAATPIHIVTYYDAAMADQGRFIMKDYDGDGKDDLIFIRTINAEAKSVEVHVITAASGYQKTTYNSGTVYTYGEANNGLFFMSDNKYLVYLQTKNTASDYINMDLVSNYSDFKTVEIEATTGFNVKDYATYCVGPGSKDIDDFVEVYQIKTAGGVKKVEVHGIMFASNWKLGWLDAETIFEPENAGYWLMANWTNGAFPDLAYIKVGNTGTGMVEVHIAASG